MTLVWKKTNAGWRQLPLEKWAVENHNLLTGEKVRLMETPQEWTAEVLAASANTYFTENSLPCKSVVVRA